MTHAYRQQAGEAFYLQQELDSLNGSDSSFGDGRGNATGQKVFHETNNRVRHGWRRLCRYESPDFSNLTKLLRETQRPSKWTQPLQLPQYITSVYRENCGWWSSVSTNRFTRQNKYPRLKFSSWTTPCSRGPSCRGHLKETICVFNYSYLNTYTLFPDSIDIFKGCA